MDEDFDGDWSDLVFGLVGIVWFVVVVVLIWTFVKAFCLSVLGMDEAKDER